MNRTNKKNVISAALAAAVALLFSVLTQIIDVRPAGYNGTDIGCAALNTKVFEIFDTSMKWYYITELLGVVAILIAAGFGLVGLVQLIKRKKLLSVDREILALGVLYIITILVYVIFLKVNINLRPALLPGETEPENSFPSSHTLLVCVVFGSGMQVLNKYIKSVKGRVLLRTALSIGIIVMIFGRMLSGAHWLTDIAAGGLIALAFLSVFKTAIEWECKQSDDTAENGEIA